MTDFVCICFSLSKDMYSVAGVLMELPLIHGGAAPQLFSKMDKPRIYRCQVDGGAG